MAGTLRHSVEQLHKDMVRTQDQTTSNVPRPLGEGTHLFVVVGESAHFNVSVERLLSVDADNVKSKKERKKMSEMKAQA
jgi:hypothetical protein